MLSVLLGADSLSIILSPLKARLDIGFESSDKALQCIAMKWLYESYELKSSQALSLVQAVAKALVKRSKETDTETY